MQRTLKNKTVMVTGGAGFIGSHLVDRLLEDGACAVIVIDNLFLGTEINLVTAFKSGRVTLYRDDAEFMSSLEYIFERHSIDVVFNCATKPLNYSFMNPSNAFSTNVAVVMNLLELQRKGMFSTLCHFSTSEVYGTAVYQPMDEEHPKIPTTTYAAGKAAADLAVESYVRMFGLDAIIVRPFNNYGPRQNYKGVLAGVIPITAMRILNDLPPEIHGDGLQSRDFVYVFDTVDAVVKLYGVLKAGEAVNVANENQISINDLMIKISQKMNYTGKILHKIGRSSDVMCHVASSDKIRKIIDFSSTPFNEGLHLTLEYYRSVFNN